MEPFTLAFFRFQVKPVSNTTSVHIMKVRQYMDAGNVSEAAYLATVMLGSVRQNMVRQLKMSC